MGENVEGFFLNGLHTHFYWNWKANAFTEKNVRPESESDCFNHLSTC